MMKKTFFIFLLVLSLKSYASDDFDFVLVSNRCEMLLSVNKLDEDSLQHHNADLSVIFCTRHSKAVNCKIMHPESEKKIFNSAYKIHLDSPPLLMFSTDNGSEMVLINSNEHAASYTSRIITGEVLGYKVCNMAFFTYDQYKALSNEKNPVVK